MGVVLDVWLEIVWIAKACWLVFPGTCIGLGVYAKIGIESSKE